MKGKTIKLLDEYSGSYLLNYEVGTDFFKQGIKSINIQENCDKSDYSKIKIFSPSKDSMKRVKKINQSRRRYF